MEYTSPRAAAAQAAGVSTKGSFADIARAVGERATRGAQLGTAAQAAEVMGDILLNNVPGLPAWFKTSELARAGCSLVAPVGLLGLCKFFPTQVPSSDKLEKVALFAVEGYSAVRVFGWVGKIRPALASLVAYADTMDSAPADDAQV